MSAPSPTVPRGRVTPAAPVGLAVLGLVLAGLAARPVVTSTSAELPEVVAALHGSGVLTGLISALPPLVFALGSFLAPPVVGRLGVAHALAVAAVTAAVGLVLRVTVVGTAVFLTGTVIALAGIALANVCLPAAVKRYLPDRAGLGTAVYTLMLALGTALAAAATVPVGSLVGGWRVGLGVWAGLAAVAAPPWLALARRTPAAAPAPSHVPSHVPSRTGRVGPGRSRQLGIADIARTRLGRAAAILFAGQASSAYVMFAYLPQIATDHGLSDATGGLLLGWFSLLGVVAAAVPLLVGRLRDQRWLIWALAGLWVVGDLTLGFVPGGAWVATTAAGLGGSLFTVALALIPLRSATVDGSSALSAFSQGVAYLVSATVVFAAGVVRDLTGSFNLVLPVLALLMVPVAIAGNRAGQEAVVEEETGGSG